MKGRLPPSLLEAKLFPDAGASHPIQRPRLEPPDSVLEGRCSVAAIVAPAGYGKSTLMAHWLQRLREAGAHCAWLSVDEDDNDSARLLNYLIAALRAQNPGIGADALGQIDAPVDSEPGAGTPGPLLESLAADLSAAGQRLALFLDDLHALHDPRALRVVEWLINYAPANVQFVLGGRELRRIRLSGLRLRGRLFELDRRQLMFDMEEAGRFYRSRLAQTLSASELAQLMEKTEGWPAGLQLAALALEGLDGEERREDLIDGFTGSDLGVVEYLGDMVLGRLDDATRRFLHVVAQFDRFNGALAAVASGQADAPERLTELHARGLFLIALDRRGEWFRFHHLVGEFFRGRAPPGLAPRAGAAAEVAAEALLRGARWLHAEGLAEEAISCAIRARQWEQACAWLDEHIEETSHSRGSHRLVLRWMNEIPRQWVDRHPLIPAHYAFSLAFTHRRREAEQQLARLDGLLSGMEHAPEADPAAIDELRRAVELERALLAGLCDEGREARDAAQRWQARWPGAPAVQLGSCQNLQAFGHKCCGEVGAGLAMVARARRTLLAGEHGYGLSWSLGIEALLHMKQGDYTAARACCEQGLALLSERLAGGGAQRCLFEVTLAAVAYEFDQIPRAHEALERGLPNLEEAATADWLMLAYLTQARLMMLAGNDEGAIATLREGQTLARGRALPRLEITLAAEECAWLCRRAQWGAAMVLARRHGFERIADAALPHTAAADKSWRIGARLALMREPARVAQALAPAVADARRRGFAHREAELQLLRAAALRRCGQTDDMQQALAAASRLGQSHGYRRVFLDDADLLQPLLAQAGGDDAAWLRGLFEGAAAPARHGQTGGELTKRELNILSRLESGLSNREIAESLFISEATLKWHLHNIYGKLEVRNRSGAIAAVKRLKWR
jgi:ATP/maltotriose-dependent transcriptional regulator MalT